MVSTIDGLQGAEPETDGVGRLSRAGDDQFAVVTRISKGFTGDDSFERSLRSKGGEQVGHIDMRQHRLAQLIRSVSEKDFGPRIILANHPEGKEHRHTHAAGAVLGIVEKTEYSQPTVVADLGIDVDDVVAFGKELILGVVNRELATHRLGTDMIVAVRPAVIYPFQNSVAESLGSRDTVYQNVSLSGVEGTQGLTSGGIHLSVKGNAEDNEPFNISYMPPRQAIDLL